MEKAADMGAELVRIDRCGAVGTDFPAEPRADILARGRRSIGGGLKHPEGVETVLPPEPTPARSLDWLPGFAIGTE